MRHQAMRPPDFDVEAAAKSGLSDYHKAPEGGCQVDPAAPLVDISPSGRPMPWAQHRSAADFLALLYDQTNPSKAARLRGCAPRLLFRPTEDGGQRLHAAWFCRVRLCPVCQWRRSLKLYGQISEIYKALEKRRAAEGRKPCAWIMLTLTQKNVDALELPEEIDRLMAAWHRLIKRKPFERAVLGWQRSLEVTHNNDLGSAAYDTYHPHFHAILCVNESYFTDSRVYLRRSEWQRLWKEAMRLDYYPDVHVKRIKSANIQSALAETTKYTAKPSDYIQPDDLDKSLEVLYCLDRALDHRRLVAWGGLLKELHAALGLDDVEDGDLIHTDNEDTEDGEPLALIAYSWRPGHRNYYKEVLPWIGTDPKKRNNVKVVKWVGGCPPTIALPPTTGGKS